MRKVWIFCTALCILVGGGAALWFFAASKLDSTVNDFKKRLADKGQVLECASQDVRGFPFRLGVFCDSLKFSDQRKAISIETAAVRSAAQVYAPGKMVTEIDSPASIQVPDRPPVKLDWQSLRSSINANLDGLKRFSLSINGLRANLQSTPDQTGQAETLEFHSRRVDENDIEIASGAVNASLTSTDGPGLTPLSYVVEISARDLFDQSRDLNRLLDAARTNGAEGTITTIKITPNSGGSIRISGPYSVNPSGEVTARLSVELEKLGALAEYLQTNWPDRPKDFDKNLQTITTLFSAAMDGKQTFNISISNNNVSWGLFPLGRLPKLF